MAGHHAHPPAVLVTATITAPGLAAPITVHVARDVSVPPAPEPVDDTPYSHAYTGRHDGGDLPPLRTDNVYGHVVAALMQAKAEVDAELVALVPKAAGPERKVRGV